MPTIKRVHVRDMRLQPVDVLGSGCPKAAEPACSVSADLALTLRISRWCGLAPVRMVTRRNQIRVSWSWPMAAYSYLLLLSLDIIFLFKIRNVVTMDIQRSFCDIKKVVCVLSMIKEALVLFVLNLGVCGGRRKMTSIISYLNQVNAIISAVNEGCPRQVAEKKRSLFVVVYLAALWILYLIDFSFTIRYSIIYNKYMLETVLSGTYYFSAIALVVFEIQYVLMALSIDTALSSINDFFTKLILNIDMKSNSPSFDVKAQGDSLHLVTEWCSATHALASQVPGSQGFELPTLVASLTLLLLLNTYYALMFYSMQEVHYTFLLLALSSCFYYAITLLILVEPGHRLRQETTRTRTLLSQLLTRPWARLSPLADEADLLFRLLTGRQPRCCPMGVCEITRPLVCTVLSGVTTYLVIAVQYQQIDD